MILINEVVETIICQFVLDYHFSIEKFGINEDCKDNVNNELLDSLSKELDRATLEVFKSLDQLKKDNIFEEKVIPKIQKQSFKEEPKFEIKHTEKTTKIVGSKTNDDEWESF